MLFLLEWVGLLVSTVIFTFILFVICMILAGFAPLPGNNSNHNYRIFYKQ